VRGAFQVALRFSSATKQDDPLLRSIDMAMVFRLRLDEDMTRDIEHHRDALGEAARAALRRYCEYLERGPGMATAPLTPEEQSRIERVRAAVGS
jgi:hypothetical protein